MWRSCCCALPAPILLDPGAIAKSLKRGLLSEAPLLLTHSLQPRGWEVESSSATCRLANMAE
jgi:hypothetical protein